VCFCGEQFCNLEKKNSGISLNIDARVQSLNNLDENERLLEYDAVLTGKYLLMLRWRFKPPSSEWQVPPETRYLFPVGHAVVSFHTYTIVSMFVKLILRDSEIS
jgi:hypothetical protein